MMMYQSGARRWGEGESMGGLRDLRPLTYSANSRFKSLRMSGGVLIVGLCVGWAGTPAALFWSTTSQGFVKHG
jgi:hypothetical protein